MTDPSSVPPRRRYSDPDPDGPDVLCLIGPMASGKTTLGRAVARHLGVPFIDTDAQIVAHHGAIADIFAADGEDGFRTLETEALRQALETADVHGGVIATGGGAVVRGENREILGHRFTVYLEIDEETVAPRIERDQHRPLLSRQEDEEPLAKWCRIFSERAGLYRETARHIVDVRSGTPSANAERIVDAYRRFRTSRGGI
ncbi:shikimate kinase [Zhihengliuella halotolerans]|uniref:shikimate kinase n=1 Tax=Zhihengliuella halotolerans TaxID=370736 RepID=UPI0011AEF644|nr:shikimate kinase [Zhihengliuella halotolerans]